MPSADQTHEMARRLRTALAMQGTDVSPSRALELIAATLGQPDHDPADDAIGFEPCSPILRIFDERKAREFYCGFLGFRPAWDTPPDPGAPLYLAVERAGLRLHLSEHHGDASPGANVFVPTVHIRAFHRELTDKAYRYGRPGLEPLPWGLQMQVHDPFGNRLRFCESHR